MGLGTRQAQMLDLKAVKQGDQLPEIWIPIPSKCAAICTVTPASIVSVVFGDAGKLYRWAVGEAGDQR